MTVGTSGQDHCTSVLDITCMILVQNAASLHLNHLQTLQYISTNSPSCFRLSKVQPVQRKTQSMYFVPSWHSTLLLKHTISLRSWLLVQCNLKNRYPAGSTRWFGTVIFSMKVTFLPSFSLGFYLSSLEDGEMDQVKSDVTNEVRQKTIWTTVHRYPHSHMTPGSNLMPTERVSGLQIGSCNVSLKQCGRMNNQLVTW